MKYFAITNQLHVLCATLVSTIICVILSIIIAVISLSQFDIDISLWTFVISLSIVIPFIVAGTISYLIFLHLMKLQNAKEKVEELSKLDFLTKAYNRGYFLDMANRELSIAKRYNRPLTVMMIDLNDFKQINDNYGHIFGDNVLIECSRRINSLIRESDLFARFGGDEFILLLPSTKLPEANKLADRIKNIVSNTKIKFDGKEATLTLSIGMAVLENEYTDLDVLINNADVDLYKSKKQN